MKFVWKISYPQRMGWLLQPKSHKLAVFEAKMSLQKQLWQPKLQTFFKWFLVLVRWKINFNISAWSHAKRLRYWVKMLLFRPLALALSATFWTNKFFETLVLEPLVFAVDVLIFFSPFCFDSPEIIRVKVDYRQTDRQTNYLTSYTGVCGFCLSVKFATSLLALLAGG